ncbi:BspA family leucine-rich repeat surface protein [Mycoplasma capricolum subsp. capricolum]|uniref:BspA family leucine-rich repeat surface protein n=1 Tax=Mycoplasma capricolum TaxID=2095 RepID=UPI003DA34E91
MKKILTILTSFSLIATSSFLVVACKTNGEKIKIEKQSKDVLENTSKEEDKNTVKHNDEISQADQSKGDEKNEKNTSSQSQINRHNLLSGGNENIFSTTEDEREFISKNYDWISKKSDSVEHYFNPNNPNEILMLGYERTTKKDKVEYKLKQIPTNVNKVPSYLPKIFTSLESAFKNNINMDIQGIENWDTSNVNNMYQTFYGAENFNGDISKWKTNNVNYLSYMFYGASSFKRDLSGWNVSKTPYQSNFGTNSGFANQKDLWPPFSNK